jgi:hypothetical protein
MEVKFNMQICDNREVEQSLMELLHAVQQADIETYRSKVSRNVTCFEPETKGHLLRGIDLHLFFLTQSKPVKLYNIELIDPVFRASDSMAYVAYTLHLAEMVEGQEDIKSENVTRIFHLEDGVWKMIHFHRSCLQN